MIRPLAQLNEEELVMHHLLSRDPEMAYVSKDGMRVYTLAFGYMWCLKEQGTNFNQVSEDRLARFVISEKKRILDHVMSSKHKKSSTKETT